MKKFLLTTLTALLPLTACAHDPNVKAYCDNIWKTASPGWVSISSLHGVTIINKTTKNLVYDVYFDNAIQYRKSREMPLDYKEAPYTPNAHEELHFSVASGQTLYYGEVGIEKIAGFQTKGRYKTRATTHIMYNGVELDSCEHYTNVDIV